MYLKYLYLYKKLYLKKNLRTKSDPNIHQNEPLKKLLGGEGMPQIPLEKRNLEMELTEAISLRRRGGYCLAKNTLLSVPYKYLAVHLVHSASAVHMIYLDFSKAFHKTSLNISLVR